MIYQTHYITREDLGFNELADDVKLPIPLESSGFLLCLEGESEVVVDMKHYQIRASDITVAFPSTLVQMLHTSEDFKAIILTGSSDIFSNIRITNKGHYITNIKEAPCIALTPDETQKLVEWHKILLKGSEDRENPLRREIDSSLLEIIIYELAAIFNKRTPKTQQITNRENVIFHDFINQLHLNYRKHRSLDFYAHRLAITPAHLSKVIKRTSSRTATSWISECMILNIKSKLQDQRLSIAEIAEEFSFANASFFSQYFKKYARVTPKEYRNALLSQNEI